MNSVQSLSDEALIRSLQRAAAHERGATIQLIALLAEMDGRRLFLEQGYSSLFVYCTKGLHLSEHAAYGRIEAARAARKFPVILERLAKGSITLTTICLLSNHLSEENHKQLLEAAKDKTRREVEALLAALHPMPAVPSSVRKLPQPRALALSPGEMRTEAPDGSTALCPTLASVSAKPVSVGSATSPIVRPLAPARYKVQFSIGPETHEKLRRLQNLLRHSVPNGAVAEIFDRALTLLLRQVERRKVAQVERPRAPTATNPTGRHVPASVKRQVWARDEGRCAFAGKQCRCEERGFLEFHHVIPFAEGGETTVENLQLRCRAHNDYEARKWWEREPGDENSSCTTG